MNTETKPKTYLVKFTRTVVEEVEVEITLDPEDYTIESTGDLEFALRWEVEMLDIDDGEVLDRCLIVDLEIDDYKELSDD